MMNSSSSTSALPPFERKLGSARVCIRGGELEASTGRATRRWKWTGRGWVTTALRDESAGRDWITREPTVACDWDLPGALGDDTAGQLISCELAERDDEGFSGRHLEVVSTVRYDEAKLEVQHVVWAFPGAPGLRTQLRVKALPGFDPEGVTGGDGTYKDCGATFPRPGARNEYLPLDFSVPNERLYWGYYNNPGNRHDQSQDMLKEQLVKGWPLFLREDIDWASGAAVKYGEAGVLLVKESPKCVNQPAHDTGAFFGRPWGLCSTGWGLTPAEFTADRFRECWAHWILVYDGGDDGLQRALKEFDAARYPVFPKRDLFILSNTWGPSNPLGEQFTDEEFVLKEIPALAEVGVDLMQIDDGWQCSGSLWDARDFRPKYQNGWKDIKAAADRHGLRLGLWVAIRNANLAELERNLDELGFISWKADFDRLASRADYEQRLASYRAVMKHAWMKTQFALCPEYDDPRYGWYFAREYGSLFFQNVQEALPEHLTMVPFQVLRQHWLMAKYFPANKLQVMLQNPKRVGPCGDGRAHSHAYCFAMGLPFVPCFFQSAQFLDAEGRRELRALIDVYKSCREDLFTSLAYPIGDQPDNASWSGFQLVSRQRPGGHLVLFRELHNPEPRRSLRLKFLAGQTIILTDLMNREAPRTLTVGAAGQVSFDIPRPADFRFFRYEIQNAHRTAAQ